MAMQYLQTAITRRRLLGAGAGLAAIAAAVSVHRTFFSAGDAPPLGFNLAAWETEINADASAWRRAIEDVHGFGVRRVTLVPYWFVDPVRGAVSAASSNGLPPGPGPAVLAEVIRAGAELGMDIALKPLVEVDTRDGFGHSWRGDLGFEGAQQKRFFSQYRGYIEEMAQLCIDHGARKLYLGSEMAAMTAQKSARPYWDGLIADLNRSYRSAERQLSYAANYDEIDAVWFWKDLDEIAVDAYFALATKEEAAGRGNPSVDLLRRQWMRRLGEVRRLSHRLGLPVTISEFGIIPFDLASTQPWNWAKPIVSNDAPDDDRQEMLNAIEALLEVTRDAGGWLAGIDFWHWRVPRSQGSVYNIEADSPAGRLISRYVV